MDNQNDQNFENQKNQVNEEVTAAEVKKSLPKKTKMAIIISAGILLVAALALLLIFVVFKHKHDWSTWQTVKEATCSEEGQEIRTCECGEVETKNIPILDHDGTTGLHFTLLSNGTYSVSRGNTDSSEIIIPSKYKNIAVTKIENNAFSNCENLKSITIPPSVVDIGWSAFSECSSLEALTIPNSVKSIGFSALKGCSNLKNLTIPFVGATENGSGNKHFGHIFGAASYQDHEKVGYIPTSLSVVIITLEDAIEDRAFQGCQYIDSISLPNTLTKIGEWAFMDCDSLTEIVIPSSVTNWQRGAFYYCERLKTVTISEGITYIGDGAFSGCEILTSIFIPNSVKTIDAGAFSGCESLNEIIIPDSVTFIGESAFSGCTSLTQIVIPKNVSILKENTFWNCKNLQSITLPEGLTTIEENVFFSCKKLNEIIIPSSVVTIGSEAFKSCSNLSSVVFVKTNGWKAGFTSLSSNELSNASTAATYLTTKYYYSEWICQ